MSLRDSEPECINSFPGEPDYSGSWKGRKIEGYSSEAYGLVVFYSDTDEEVECEIELISELVDCLSPIETSKKF
ncbi:hypothetical protein [Shewanella sp. MBTL60-007]|uniref:hypothetical protein n=1 Tax=Shewanella sp. MBTL60-007 TaxID=2815911 RepID=UPI001BC3D9E1|nr:hypothetical protein [Shewanella sp. MBTL60-007]GIU21044.1 hypothetical protein TUM3792_21490 [Shewanella sp. MBTL60-007]